MKHIPLTAYQGTGGKPYRDPDVLRSLYHGEKWTLYDLSDYFGVCVGTVHKWMEQNGIDRRSQADAEVLKDDRGGPWRDEDRLRELYVDEGLNRLEVAERLGCSEPNIQYWMNQHGIQPRPSGNIPRSDRDKAWYGRQRWRRLSDEVRERDSRQCQDCGMGQDEHMNRWNAKHDVHHITPVNEGGDRYDPDNLVTLCKACHKTVEREVNSVC